MKKTLSFLLGMVTRFDDETAILRDESAHRSDDACPIRAGDGQGIAVFSHSAIP
jgi:hypothetical protein